MGRKLFVGNLPFDTADADLQQMFAAVGAVESVTLMRDQSTGRSRGFAFVEMATDEAARQAIADLNNTPLGGRQLTVNEARPREAGGGGGRQNDRQRW
jgi:RNA recognition motif-containing protein